MIKELLGLHLVNTHEWTTNLSVKVWRSKIDSKESLQCKAMASLIMLVSRTVSKERNARVLITNPPRLQSSLISSRARLGFGLPWMQSILAM
jgi:hypothetical protein